MHLLAGSELERSDTCMPVESAVNSKVLIRVPHGAIVTRIDAQGGIITPAGEVWKLRAGAREQIYFRAQSVDWIGYVASGKAYGGIEA